MCLAIPGQVRSIHHSETLLMGRIDFGGASTEVCLAYLDDPKVGEYVLVHVGFAIAKVDQKMAQETLALWEEIGELPDPKPTSSDESFTPGQDATP